MFGIRVDQAVQELRDFIVDSQLMQDFDDPSAAHAQPQRRGALPDAPDAGRRHQGAAGERVGQALGRPGEHHRPGQRPELYLGPNDDQFASVKTSSTVTLVIVSGYTQADGSDSVRHECGAAARVGVRS